MSHPLKEIRLVKKLTQSQCGRVLNVSGQIVSQIENGSYNPGNEILAKIALTFELDPGNFIKSVEQYLVSRRRALKKQIASS